MGGSFGLELSENVFGGLDGTASGKGEIGPVGVGVGVVDDADKERKLVGISGLL